MSLSKIPFPTLLPVETELKHLRKADYRFMPWPPFPDRQRWLDRRPDEMHRIVGNKAPGGKTEPPASSAPRSSGSGRGRRGPCRARSGGHQGVKSSVDLPEKGGTSVNK